ncbi:MAG: MBL fold metallo-hydrolase [Saprospiraceae bacterium]
MKLTFVPTGRFKLDGGAMFGVVPKQMWQKLNPPDERNMCTWFMNALLVETGDRKILIDTGLGDKQDAKFRSHFEPHGDESLLGSLANLGLQPEAITDVFLTHLHFDHCGGALYLDPQTGESKPTFPNAIYWSNQVHFDWAMNPNDRERASFLKENFLPLQEMGRLQMIPLEEGIRCVKVSRFSFVYGHTEAMMLVELQTENQTFICARLISNPITMLVCPTLWLMIFGH